jgi:hypothetical protein
MKALIYSGPGKETNPRIVPNGASAAVSRFDREPPSLGRNLPATPIKMRNRAQLQ